MSKLSEFEIKFYESFAEKFVQLWDEFSSHEAALYAVDHVRMENMEKAQPFVTEEFIRRGYTF